MANSLHHTLHKHLRGVAGGTKHYQQSCICTVQRLKSAWVSAQSDQSLCCEERYLKKKRYEAEGAKEYMWLNSISGSKQPRCRQQRFRSDWVDAQADLSLSLHAPESLPHAHATVLVLSCCSSF